MLILVTIKVTAFAYMIHVPSYIVIWLKIFDLNISHIFQMQFFRTPVVPCGRSKKQSLKIEISGNKVFLCFEIKSSNLSEFYMSWRFYYISFSSILFRFFLGFVIFLQIYNHYVPFFLQQSSSKYRSSLKFHGRAKNR